MARKKERVSIFIGKARDVYLRCRYGPLPVPIGYGSPTVKLFACPERTLVVVELKLLIFYNQMNAIQEEMDARCPLNWVRMQGYRSL